MARITLSPDTSNNPVIQNIFKELKQAKGFVPAPYRAFALHEHILQANWNKTKQVSTEGNIPQILKEQIALAVSSVNQCHFCVYVHSENLKKKGLSREEIISISHAQSKDKKTDFVLKLVTKATKHPHKLSDRDFQILREFGYTDQDILEIFTVMEMYTGYNKIVTALDITRDD